MNKFLKDFSCGHSELVPDNLGWRESDGATYCSQCSAKIDEYYADSMPPLPELTEEQIEQLERMQQKIEDYGFDKPFEFTGQYT